MKLSVLVGLAFACAVIACFELVIWAEPFTRTFTLGGHLMAQFGVLAVSGPFAIVAAQKCTLGADDQSWTLRCGRRALMPQKTVD